MFDFIAYTGIIALLTLFKPVVTFYYNYMVPMLIPALITYTTALYISELYNSKINTSEVKHKIDVVDRIKSFYPHGLRKLSCLSGAINNNVNVNSNADVIKEFDYILNKRLLNGFINHVNTTEFGNRVIHSLIWDIDYRI